MSVVPTEPIQPVVITPAPPSFRFDADTVPADRNPYLLTIARLHSADSRRTIQGCLDRIAEIIVPIHDPGEPVTNSGASFAWWLLRYEHGMLLLTALSEHGYAAASINTHLSAYRQVLKMSWRLKLMNIEDLTAATDIQNVKGKRLPTGRNVADSEVEAMLAVCARDPRPQGLRDAALIAVLASTGVREQEVASLLIENLDSSERAIKVTGKGDKEREIYLHADAMAYVDRWLVWLTAKDGPMFRPITRWLTVRDVPLHRTAILLIVRERRQQAGLRPLTVHDMRRTFVSNLLDQGVDLVTVQELVGHASPATTQRYDRRPARGRRAAVDKLHLPSPDEVAEREQSAST